ncbi:MAG TPA: hypothetical protein VIC30_11565 [Orrella sp.]
MVPHFAPHLVALTPHRALQRDAHFDAHCATAGDMASADVSANADSFARLFMKSPLVVGQFVELFNNVVTTYSIPNAL